MMPRRQRHGSSRESSIRLEPHYYIKRRKDKSCRTLQPYVTNIVHSTYNGVYHVNVTLYFYPYNNGSKSMVGDVKLGTLALGFDTAADLILPISRSLPLNDVLWFEIENATDVKSKEFSVLQNVYVSFHNADEFWYTNSPNEYIKANDLNWNGNGPFRKVLVSLNGTVFGAVWPFMVVYTGGINSLLWRPITGIGWFDLPTYDIEITTPFLEGLLDGKNHQISFGVMNALNIWYLDANLHLWLDKKSTKTQAKLVQYNPAPLAGSPVLDFKGLDGKFVTKYTRSIRSAGLVQSLCGNITTVREQSFNYSNIMVLGNEACMQIIDQVIQFNDSVEAATLNSSLASVRSYSYFPFHLFTDKGNGTYQHVAVITFSFDEQINKNPGIEFSNSLLKNTQKGQSHAKYKDNSWVSGSGSTQQVYRYDSSKSCYFRNVSSSYYVIQYDHVCKGTAKVATGLKPNSLSRVRWSGHGRLGDYSCIK